MPAFFNVITPIVSTAVNFVTTNLQAYYDAQNPGVSGWESLHNTYNSTGYTRNMSLGNGAAITTIGGVAAAYFDGVNDYAGLQTRPTIAGNPMNSTELLNFTNEIWVRSNGAWLSNGNIWAANYNQATRVRIQSNDLRVYAPAMDSSFAGTYGNTTTTWTINTWHHFAFTMENLGATNDRFIVYRNGVEIGRDTTGNYAPSVAQDDFFIGTYNASGEFQRQYVGLLRRYNIALTAAQVTQNFNAEKARFGY